MRSLVSALIISLTIGLAGCQNEPEETPDITEAIPVDEDTDADTDDAGGPVGDAANTGADSTPVPGEPEPPALPSSSESGSNLDTSVYGGESEGAPDPGTGKLQPADPPS